MVDLGVGEGDGAAAEIQIRYRRPGGPEVLITHWQYLYDEATSSWRLNKHD